MYLHLGKGIVARTDDILAVCDLDTSSHSYITREYLTRTQEKDEIINIGDELPKSFIIVREGSGQRVYLSQLTSATLLRRNDTGSLD